MEPEIKSKQLGEVAIATDGDISVIATTEEQAVEAVQEIQQANAKIPVPAPIENPKGSGWFAGTSWGA